MQLRAASEICFVESSRHGTDQYIISGVDSILDRIQTDDETNLPLTEEKKIGKTVGQTAHPADFFRLSSLQQCKGEDSILLRLVLVEALSYAIV
jgi:hypothetical protein